MRIALRSGVLRGRGLMRRLRVSGGRTIGVVRRRPRHIVRRRIGRRSGVRNLVIRVIGRSARRRWTIYIVCGISLGRAHCIVITLRRGSSVRS